MIAQEDADGCALHELRKEREGGGRTPCGNGGQGKGQFGLACFAPLHVCHRKSFRTSSRQLVSCTLLQLSSSRLRNFAS